MDFIRNIFNVVKDFFDVYGMLIKVAIFMPFFMHFLSNYLSGRDVEKNEFSISLVMICIWSVILGILAVYIDTYSFNITQIVCVSTSIWIIVMVSTIGMTMFKEWKDNKKTKTCDTKNEIGEIQKEIGKSIKNLHK